MEINVSKLRTDLPQVGVQPYRQVHAHSTGNPHSTVQNEADYQLAERPRIRFFLAHCWERLHHAGRTC
ncbi:lytic amidase [Streptococcus pneumoniae]|nr:lytic amidase [Streptococcus pneumoniae]